MALPWKGCYSSCSEWRGHPQVLPDHWPACVAPRGFGDSALRFEMRVCTGGFDLWLQGQSTLALAVYATVGKAGSEILPPARGAPPPGIMEREQPHVVSIKTK